MLKVYDDSNFKYSVKILPKFLWSSTMQDEKKTKFKFLFKHLQPTYKFAVNFLASLIPLRACTVMTVHGYEILNHQSKPKFYSSSSKEIFQHWMEATRIFLASTANINTLNQAAHFPYNSGETRSRDSLH